MNIDWIIVGMGNPGSRYSETRHNIGWMVCENLCRKCNATVTPGKGDYYQAMLRIRGKSVLVVFPTTYMNDSGRAVKKAMTQFEVSHLNTLVVVDEFNFPVGKIHLKLGGSDGGHNGTQSVIDELQTTQFWRLRCGIEKNFGMGELVQYVLSPFAANETEARDKMIEYSVEAIEYILHAGTSLAMSHINSGMTLFEKKEEKSK